MVDLSILVTTVPTRESLLSRLLWTLQPQLTDNVEVIIHTPHIGLGDKTTELYQAASGRFSVQIDDDDLVPANYIAMLAPYLPSQDVDYIGYKTLYTVNGKYVQTYTSDPRTASHLPYSGNLQLRHVVHKCPLLTSEARKHPFGNEYGADYYWVSALIKGGYPHNPVFLNSIGYHYDAWPDFSMGTRPIAEEQRDVGKWPYEGSRFLWI